MKDLVAMSVHIRGKVMKKIVYISNCKECPHTYHSREEGWGCSLTKKSLCWDLYDTENKYGDTIKTFPTWCPLETKRKSK